MLLQLHSHRQHQQNMVSFELSVRRKHTTTRLFGWVMEKWIWPLASSCPFPTSITLINTTNTNYNCVNKQPHDSDITSLTKGDSAW